MRPTRLEFEGFGAFRGRVDVDFEDASYFAFVGPTGAGKSTVIDAVCFALYGSVPRYDHEGLVAPVISQGSLEAKVRLDFTIAGTPYTAVRVVRRRGKGATTNEARLESYGDVLAGTADEVTAGVTGLVGLSFKQFTKCVVLPQGDFARFLHDTPGNRQDLIIRLLNLEVYDRMRYAASQRAETAKSHARVCEERLTDLSEVTPAALVEAMGRAKRLEALRTLVDEARPRLKEFADTAAASAAEAQEAADSVTAIERLAMPVHVAELATELRAAQEAVKAAEKSARAARSEVERTKKVADALPDAAPLQAAAEAHRDRADIAEKLERARARAEKAARAAARAEQSLKTARSKENEASGRVDALRDEHAAHHLAAGLKPGEPCPVCTQLVERPPKRKAPAAIAQAQKALDAAVTAVAKADATARAAEKEATTAATTVTSLTERLGTLDERTADHPDLAALEAKLEQVAAIKAALEEARDKETAAVDAFDAARKLRDEAIERQTALRGDFDAARDALVHLGAPAAQGRDLAQDWQRLIEWAKKQTAPLTQREREAHRAAEAASKAGEHLTAEIERSCLECDVHLAGREPFEAVVTAVADAKAMIGRMNDSLEQGKKLRRELKEHQASGAVAAELANHLSARHFERWIVNEALRRLVIGATEILGNLSEDRYKLSIDDAGNFLVIDHHNADEARSARTLSGGETFLASLALALALADQVADLAAEGAARLEAIFLDEGFGTLDPETLETVASTVETLAATGRMVGIVTHVRELADRVPIQYRVRKDPLGSIIEKVAP